MTAVMRSEEFRRIGFIVKELICVVALVAFTIFCFTFVASHPFVPAMVAWVVLVFSAAVICGSISNIIYEIKCVPAVG